MVRGYIYSLGSIHSHAVEWVPQLRHAAKLNGKGGLLDTQQNLISSLSIMKKTTTCRFAVVNHISCIEFYPVKHLSPKGSNISLNFHETRPCFGSFSCSALFHYRHVVVSYSLIRFL